MSDHLESTDLHEFQSARERAVFLSSVRDDFVVHFCREDFKFISWSSVGLELWDWIDIRPRIKIDNEIFLDGDFA